MPFCSDVSSSLFLIAIVLKKTECCVNVPFFFDRDLTTIVHVFCDRDAITIVILLVERDRDRERSSFGNMLYPSLQTRNGFKTP